MVAAQNSYRFHGAGEGAATLITELVRSLENTKYNGVNETHRVFQQLKGNVK